MISDQLGDQPAGRCDQSAGQLGDQRSVSIIIIIVGCRMPIIVQVAGCIVVGDTIDCIHTLAEVRLGVAVIMMSRLLALVTAASDVTLMVATVTCMAA